MIWTIETRWISGSIITGIFAVQQHHQLNWKMYLLINKLLELDKTKLKFKDKL